MDGDRRLWRWTGALGAAVALTVGSTLPACSDDATARVAGDPPAEFTATEPAGDDLEPVRAVDHASGRQDGPVEVSVAGTDGVGVTFREITLAPGASTGEHCHHGQLVAVVAEGRLTHYADVYAGGVHVYEEGDSIIEGAGYRHEGRNEGDEDVVLWVTYIIPEGEPLAETDLSRCDA